jgi:predicted phosphodiesterase
MRLGVLAEIHANLPALESSLEALRKEGVERVVAIGDILGYGPHPRQVIRRLDREGIPCVPGAADLKVAYALPGQIREGVADKTVAWTKEQLNTKELNFLRNMRSRHRFDTAFGKLLMFYGSPEDPEQKMDLEAHPADVIKTFEGLRARFAVVAGRHIIFRRQVEKNILIDPGSVGLTLGGEPGADVLIVEEDLKGNLVFRFLKVNYDYAQVIFDLTAWELPPVLTEVVRQGRFPG